MARSVFVAVPTRDNSIDAGCCMALLANIRQLDRLGFEVELHFEAPNCYIDDARNRIAKTFLASGRDRLLFVDSDLCFSPDAFAKVLAYSADVVAGVYPMKRDDNQWATAHIETDADGYPIGDAVTGLVSANMAPTGLMCIKRQVFERMEKEHPEWRIDNNGGMMEYFPRGRCFAGDNNSYGEDVAFCKRWKAMGGQIWIYPDIDFEHVGKKAFSGNFHKYLLVKKE